jgi:hypothetical protein
MLLKAASEPLTLAAWDGSVGSMLLPPLQSLDSMHIYEWEDLVN